MYRKLRLLFDEIDLTLEFRRLRFIGPQDSVTAVWLRGDDIHYSVKLGDGVGAPVWKSVRAEDFAPILLFVGNTYIVSVLQDPGTGNLEFHLLSEREPRLLKWGHQVGGTRYAALPVLTFLQWREAQPPVPRHAMPTTITAQAQTEPTTKARDVAPSTFEIPVNHPSANLKERHI